MSSRFLNDTVTLFNYAGEDSTLETPVYEKTVISKCCLFASNGASADRKPSDGAKLYLFHNKTVCKSSSGEDKTYVDYETWNAMTSENKALHWTIGETGDDFIVAGTSSASVPPTNGKSHRITSFKELKKGSKNMWHFEVMCK